MVVECWRRKSDTWKCAELYSRINDEVYEVYNELRTESFSANKQIEYASEYAVSKDQTMFNRVISM